jgi:hypothetical protein
MPRESDIKEALARFPEWEALTKKNNILRGLQRSLEENEEITEFCEGFVISPLLKGSPATGLHGLFFLTSRQALFLPIESNTQPGFTFGYDEILTLSTQEGYLAPAIIMTISKNNRALEIRFSPVSSAKTSSRFFKKLNQLMTPTTETPPIEEELSRQNFLFEEAKKIVFLLYGLLQKKDLADLREALLEDFKQIAGFCHSHTESINEDSKIFLALCMMPFFKTDGDSKKLIDELYGLDSFPLHKKKMLISFYTGFKGQLRAIALPETLDTLAALETRGKIADADYALRFRSVILTFAQCFVKADDKVTSGEAKVITQINSLVQRSPEISVDSRTENELSVPAQNSGTRKAKNNETDKTDGEERALSLEDILKEIDALVGMKNIKDQIKTFINLAKVEKEREKKELPVSALSLHAVFYGPPGTGKTTIARLLGRVYKCLALLTKGQLVETDRAGLVAGYVGQTALKVDEVVAKALDGILFIDEAYSLIPEDDSKDFGKEAVDKAHGRLPGEACGHCGRVSRRNETLYRIQSGIEIALFPLLLFRPLNAGRALSNLRKLREENGAHRRRIGKRKTGRPFQRALQGTHPQLRQRQARAKHLRKNNRASGQPARSAYAFVQGIAPHYRERRYSREGARRTAYLNSNSISV